MPAKYWTKDLCELEAKRHPTKSSLRAAYPRVYKLICVNGWHHMFAHMTSPQVPRGYWQNFDHVLQEAKRAGSYKKFIKSKGAYASALSHGWLDKLELKQSRNPPYSWTRDRILALAKNYSRQIDFIRENPKAYQASCKKGLWPEIRLLLQPTKMRWNFEACLEAALICSTRSEFGRKFPGAYGLALRNTFLNDICKHMRRPWSSFGECSIEEFLMAHDIDYERQKKFPKLPRFLRYDFYLPKYQMIIEHHGSPHYQLGWGRTLEKKRQHLQGVKHRDQLKMEFATKNGMKFVVIWQFDYKGKDEIQALLRDRLVSHVPKLSFHRRNLSEEEINLIWREKISFEDCEREAKRYSSRSEFKREAKPYWMFAHENGFIDEICTHMKRPAPHNKRRLDS